MFLKCWDESRRRIRLFTDVRYLTLIGQDDNVGMPWIHKSGRRRNCVYFFLEPQPRILEIRVETRCAICLLQQTMYGHFRRFYLRVPFRQVDRV